MFEGLSDKLSTILNSLTRRGALTEEDVNAALREVRRALLEADVALEVVRSFTDKVRARAVGAEVIKSVSPGQQVVKIVHDQLAEMLGADAEVIDLNAAPPVGILMVGLQGSGKTTTTAKIARRLTEREKRRVLMASLDTRRPCRAGAARGPGPAGGRRHPSHRGRTIGGADRPARHGGRAPWRLRRGDARHGGPRHRGRGPDGGGRRSALRHEPP
jgi:Mrp family chromosome partitioning ATPase